MTRTLRLTLDELKPFYDNVPKKWADRLWELLSDEEARMVDPRRFRREGEPVRATPRSEPHVVSEGGTPEAAAYWEDRNAKRKA